MGVLGRLVDTGNTVLVIEHNLDVIKTADYLIDMGPEGGNGGGYVVAVGTPEKIAECETSYTGKYLRKMLGERPVEYAVVKKASQKKATHSMVAEGT